MGDFDACRFDFRIDMKNGLTPSKRKKADRTWRRNYNVNTLFKCKICGSLFDSRPALLEHKMVHNGMHCTICDLSFPRKVSYAIHMARMHPSEVESFDKMPADIANFENSDLNDIYMPFLMPDMDTSLDPEAKKLKLSQDTDLSKSLSPSHLSLPMFPQAVEWRPDLDNDLPNETNTEMEDDTPHIKVEADVQNEIDENVKVVNNIEDKDAEVTNEPQPETEKAQSTPNTPTPILPPSAMPNLMPAPTSIPQIMMPFTFAPVTSATSTAQSNSTELQTVPSLTPTPVPSLASLPQMIPAQGSNTNGPPNAPFLIHPFTPMPMPTPDANQAVSSTTSENQPMQPMAPFVFTLPQLPPITDDKGENKAPPTPTIITLPAPRPGLPQMPQGFPIPASMPQMSGAPMNLPPGFVYINVPLMSSQANTNAAPAPAPILTAFQPAQVPMSSATTTVTPAVAPVPVQMPAVPMPNLVKIEPAPSTEKQMPKHEIIKPSNKRKLKAQPPKVNRRIKPNIATPKTGNDLLLKTCEGYVCNTTPGVKTPVRGSELFQCDLGIPQPMDLYKRPQKEINFHQVKYNMAYNDENDNCEALDFSVKNKSRDALKITNGDKDPFMPANPDGALDLTCGRKDNDEDSRASSYNDDQRAMFDSYVKQELGNGSSSRGNTPTADSNGYFCDICYDTFPSAVLLNIHKTRKHKSGLSKMVEKLWQNRIKVEPNSNENADMNSSPTTVQSDALPTENKPKQTQRPRSKKDLINGFIIDNFDQGSSNNAKESSQEFCTFKFHTCKVCKALFDNVADLWDHAAIHNEYMKFKCGMCKFVTVCRERLQKHKEENHPDALREKISQITQRIVKEAALTSSDSQVVIHCSVVGCQAGFANEIDLKRHIERVHTRMQCPEEGCTKSFLTAGGLKSHQISHLEDQPSTVMCSYPKCNKVFKEMRHLRAHQAVHAGTKPLVCQLCQYACRHRSSMNWHMKSKHDLEKTTTPSNRTVYTDKEGNVVCDAIREDVTAIIDEEVPVNKDESVTSPDIRILKTEPEEIQIMDTTNTNEESLNLINNTAVLQIPREELDFETDIKMEHIDHIEPTSADPEDYEKEIFESSSDENSLDVPNMNECNSSTGTVDSGFPSNSDELNGSNNSESARPSPDPGQMELQLTSVVASSPSEETQQFFTSVLKLKYVGAGSEKEPKAKAEVRKYQCKLCGIEFESAELMWEHRLKEHENMNQFFCDTCGYDTDTKESLQSHMMSTHGREMGEFKLHVCFICGKGYQSKQGLNQHLMKHSKEGAVRFTCPYHGCESRLVSKGALKSHVKKVHLKGQIRLTADGEKQLLCDFPGCDRTFKETKHLKVHQMQHTDERPLKCDFCDYACRQRNSMNWHMKSKHNKEKSVTEDGKTVYV